MYLYFLLGLNLNILFVSLSCLSLLTFYSCVTNLVQVLIIWLFPPHQSFTLLPEWPSPATSAEPPSSHGTSCQLAVSMRLSSDPWSSIQRSSHLCFRHTLYSPSLPHTQLPCISLHWTAPAHAFLSAWNALVHFCQLTVSLKIHHTNVISFVKTSPNILGWVILQFSAHSLFTATYDNYHNQLYYNHQLVMIKLWSP